MPMTPEMRQLVSDAEYPCLIFWRGKDIHLCFILDVTEREYADFYAQVTTEALQFAGLFAMQNGETACESVNLESSYVMLAASAMFAACVTEKIRRAKEQETPRTDSAEWLKFMDELWRLEDTRTEFGSA